MFAWPKAHKKEVHDIKFRMVTSYLKYLAWVWEPHQTVTTQLKPSVMSRVDSFFPRLPKETEDRLVSRLTSSQAKCNFHFNFNKSFNRQRLHEPGVFCLFVCSGLPTFSPFQRKESRILGCLLRQLR